MTGTKRTRKTYPKAFKLEAVRLMEKSNRPSVEIATELGIKRNQLYKWKEQLENKGEDALTSKLGRPLKKGQSEVTTLRQENERLREEVEILKKAAVYFAKELK
jgi:transposase